MPEIQHPDPQMQRIITETIRAGHGHVFRWWKTIDEQGKERLLAQRHIYATRKRHAQEEIRRMDNTETIIRFEEFEHRIDHMEAEADLVNFGRKPNLEDELERLALDEEIEQELSSLKTTSVGRMEDRVEALETFIDDN